jgi:hypothetical protein
MGWFGDRISPERIWRGKQKGGENNANNKPEESGQQAAKAD